METEEQTLANLEALRALFKSRLRWTKNAISRDKSGNALWTAVDTEAVSWCLSGGILKVTTKSSARSKPTINAIKKVLPAWALGADRLKFGTGSMSALVAYNDSTRTTYIGLRSLLTRAINRHKKDHGL